MEGLEDVDMDGRIILKWIYKTDWESVVDSSSSEHGQEVGCCEYGDESSGFVNCGEFIE
jgi:hypothetical protein